VLDGWWAEAYDGKNGWAIRPHDATWDTAYRAQEEASDLLDLLERRVIPEYFDDTSRWIGRAKASMKTVIPHFNAERMVREYVTRLYGPAAAHGRKLAREDGRPADALIAWKDRVEGCWDNVAVRLVGGLPQAMKAGDSLALTVEVNLAGLESDDVRVECLVSNGMTGPPQTTSLLFDPVDEADGWQRFELCFEPPFPGVQHFQIRLYPYNELLSHPLELGRMCWV
jgi:starch phosphorylase